LLTRTHAQTRTNTVRTHDNSRHSLVLLCTSGPLLVNAVVHVPGPLGKLLAALKLASKAHVLKVAHGGWIWHAWGSP